MATPRFLNGDRVLRLSIRSECAQDFGELFGGKCFHVTFGFILSRCLLELLIAIEPGSQWFN